MPGFWPIMCEAERRRLAYLFKLRLTAGVKRVLERAMQETDRQRARQTCDQTAADRIAYDRYDNRYHRRCSLGRVTLSVTGCQKDVDFEWDELGRNLASAFGERARCTDRSPISRDCPAA
jgi:hypothetical protein